VYPAARKCFIRAMLALANRWLFFMWTVEDWQTKKGVQMTESGIFDRIVNIYLQKG